MIDIYSLVPKSKFDNTNILKLDQLSDMEIEPIICELLEWLQDCNWPISKDILPIILLHQNVAIPHIINILEGNDVMWRYWIMDLVIPNLVLTNRQLLRTSLEKTAALIGDDEDTKELIEQAKKCLAFCDTTK